MISQLELTHIEPLSEPDAAKQLKKDLMKQNEIKVNTRDIGIFTLVIMIIVIILIILVVLGVM